MASGMFYHVALSGQTLCLFVFPSPSVRGVPRLHHLLRDASCFVIRCDYLVFHAGVKKKKKKKCIGLLLFSDYLLSLHGFGVALKSFPAPCSSDGACRSRLAASVSHCISQSTETVSDF